MIANTLPCTWLSMSQIYIPSIVYQMSHKTQSDSSRLPSWVCMPSPQVAEFANRCITLHVVSPPGATPEQASKPHEPSDGLLACFLRSSRPGKEHSNMHACWLLASAELLHVDLDTIITGAGQSHWIRHTQGKSRTVRSLQRKAMVTRRTCHHAFEKPLPTSRAVAADQPGYLAETHETCIPSQSSVRPIDSSVPLYSSPRSPMASATAS